MRSEVLDMKLTKYKLGELIEEFNERNRDNIYTQHDVMGLSTKKILIETKADLEGVSMTSYKIFPPKYFAYVSDTSRRGDKISLALNNQGKTIIVSSISTVFKVNNENILLPEYLFMYFNRPEFDRFARFNSWGSARETFDWNEMCDIDIELPSIEIQKKYVDIYKAMIKNQENYERGLDDLKSTVFMAVDKFKDKLEYTQIAELFEEVDERNENEYIKDIKGLNINKSFILSTSNSSNVNIKNYKVVKNGEFAFSGMQTGRDRCIRIALNDKDESIIISPAYSVFKLNTLKCIAEYIMIWFERAETDRYGWFVSDSSVRSNLDYDRFAEIKIPMPDIDTQQRIVDIYKVYKQRKEINEKLKSQIKDICPILIKGSIEEARAMMEA